MMMMAACEKQYSSDNGMLSNSISSPTKIHSIIKAEQDQPCFTAKGVPYYPITSYYNYIYPGYHGAFTQWNDSLPGAGYDLLSMGMMERDYSSEAYYMPGYNGSYADGYSVGQLPYLSYPGYFYYDPMLSYGKQAMNPYSYGQFSNGYTYGMIPDLGEYGLAPSAFAKPDDQKPAKLYTSGVSNLPMKVVDTTKSHQTDPFSGRSSYHVNQSGWVGTPPSTGTPPPLLAAYEKQSHSQSINGGDSLVRHDNKVMKSGMWNTNSRFQFNRRGHRYEYDVDELRCGPRCNDTNKWKNSSNSSSDESSTTTSASPYFGFERNDGEQLEINHENARFFVIKSYSEDDIHKCIKYGVWSSTRDGNRKLSAAFLEAEAKADKELGKTCPIFLFFSVNGSGQFVGLAEMTERVEFDKDVNFWHQPGKWSGSFKVKWHVVKDIPNSRLRHILVKSNENRPVTYSRDTQEIETKGGLDMLTIFKDYVTKSSILNDFEFYENREKVMQARKKGHISLLQKDADVPTEEGSEATTLESAT